MPMAGIGRTVVVGAQCDVARRGATALVAPRGNGPSWRTVRFDAPGRGGVGGTEGSGGSGRWWGAVRFGARGRGRVGGAEGRRTVVAHSALRRAGSQPRRWHRGETDRRGAQCASARRVAAASVAPRGNGPSWRSARFGAPGRSRVGGTEGRRTVVGDRALRPAGSQAPRWHR